MSATFERPSGMLGDGGSTFGAAGEVGRGGGPPPSMAEARQSDRGASCDRDSSQNRQMQELASDVLRLRLEQSQHRQLEGQLRSAAEKLQQMPSEKMLQLRSYLKHGLWLVGGHGTLGNKCNGGVDPENLLGLMESICVVCDVRTSRKQEDLLMATRWLLQDPAALVERLSCLPAASSSQTRRLAPFLLTCTEGWRGSLGDAGQCYEALRSWLSCYYQYSMVSERMQAVKEQLQQQERLLEELSTSQEGSTGCAGGFCGPRTWRASSGVRRSSSVQSNSSTGSRRSHSPAPDRAGLASLRPSPRVGGAASHGRPATARPSLTGSHGSGHGVPQRGSAAVPASARGTLEPGPRPASRVTSPIRNSSPLHSSHGLSGSSSRASLLARTSSGVPLSSRGAAAASAPLGGAGCSSARGALSARHGAPPPNPSPRHLEPPPRSSVAARRQNVAAVRARRSGSQDLSSCTTPRLSDPPMAPRHSPYSDVLRIDEHVESCAESPPVRVRTQEEEMEGCPSPSRGSGTGMEPSLARSRSLQKFDEPGGTPDGITPPLSTRGRPEPPLSVRDPNPPHSARLRGPQAATHRLSQQTPIQQRPSTTARVSRYGASATAQVGGPPSSSAGAPPRRTTAAPASGRFPSTRQLRPSESASTLRPSDAGSGGTVGGDAATGAAGLGAPGSSVPGGGGLGGWQMQTQHSGAPPWAATPRSLRGSASTPVLDMRNMPPAAGRLPVRGSPDQTPRQPISLRQR
eukprot:TRINITY_DN7037_c0_g2_i1.p1 TRINITY_DN7037_c0_g2~~TRINITY_DN7037_c0_g2_i1.p1  ORF type:complete len:745 (-),score=131.04 TRINITY_DN7037_c0_g2_i1:162-2396(-)